MVDHDGPLSHIHATCPYGLDHEHNGLWLKKIVLEALKEYALA
jgi:hypothetical protein